MAETRGPPVPHLYIGDFGLSREHWEATGAGDCKDTGRADASEGHEAVAEREPDSDRVTGAEAAAHRFTGEIGTPPYSAPEVRAGAAYSYSVFQYLLCSPNSTSTSTSAYLYM